MGGKDDSESFNTLDQLSGLASFLERYNQSSLTRFLFTSDKVFMARAAASFFPSLSLLMPGPVTHVDHATGNDICAGFGHAIAEQLVLSTCEILVISESGLAKVAAFLRGTDEGLYIFHDGLVERFERKSHFPNRVAW